MPVKADESGHLLFQMRQGLKAGIVTAVIGLVAIGLFVMAAGLVRENSDNWKKAIGVAAAGVLLAVWFVYEFKEFFFVERYYTDRVERLRGNMVSRQVRFNEPFKFSYAVQADGGDRLLTISGPNKAKFTILTTRKPGQPATSAEPSAQQVETLRDHLAGCIATQIEATLAASTDFAINRHFSLTPEGGQVDNHPIPWSELTMRQDHRNGDLTLFQGSNAVARLSMMSDNVLGAMQFLSSRIHQI